jgi:hypothetical protein
MVLVAVMGCGAMESSCTPVVSTYSLIDLQIISPFRGDTVPLVEIVNMNNTVAKPVLCITDRISRCDLESCCFIDSCAKTLLHGACCMHV